MVPAGRDLNSSAADTFLRLNGCYLDVEAKSTHDFITDTIARNQFRFDLIRDWISAVMRPLSSEAAHR